MHGSKIENLQRLRDAGLNVPKFVVFDFCNLVDDCVKFNKFFQEQLHKKPSEASKEIRKYLEEHYSNHGPAIKLTSETCAVRSAANIEDGKFDSFAGQFKTFLNVKAADVDAKIRECTFSICDENVISYLKEKKINADEVKLDVIVQEMVNPDYAGVIFSANPQGLLNETVITVGPGVGEGIVSEKVKTTSYYYNRTDDIYYYVGEKNYLADEIVQKIIKTVAKIESVIGKHIDIEFAIKDGKIYILQTRNITTLNADHPLILDNSNIVESYPGISLPLTISFANLIYGGVFKAECGRLLKDDEELKKHEATFRQMVGASNGRMYYKISNWYELINYLPFNKKVTRIWNDMMGVKKPLEHKTVVSKRLRARVGKNFVKELKNINKNMEWLDGHFKKIETEYRATYSENLDIKETLKLFDKVADQLFPHWDLTLINDMYAFLNVGILKKRLGDKANDVISNISNLESMKPIRELVILAHDKDLLSEKGYQKACADYIMNYGDRSLEELKLESQTFRTNPELLEENIEAYRSDMAKLETTYNNLKADKKNTSLPRGLFLKRNVRRCERGIRNREKSRLNRARIFGMVREMMLHIGAILYKEHKIAAVEDIFYLTIDEVKALPKNDENLKAIIAERKKQYELFAHLPAYSRLIFAEHEFDKNHDSVNSFVQEQDSRKLHGTPCSSGRVTGEALIIESAKQDYDTKDKILVTRSTDPGWVFMLARSKGVISERGSLLSHTAIISRELNIPSVVGVRDATKIIKNGDRITLDGEKGTIDIEEKK